MKKLFTLLLFITILQQTHAQQSLDSLRLVLPVGHSNTVRSIKFSLDGNFFISASDDSTARIFDSKSGKELKVFKCEYPLKSASFSPDGKYVLLGGHNLWPRLFDIRSGELKLKYKSNYSVECENYEVDKLHPLFSPDGNYVAYAFKNILMIWNASTGEIIHELNLIDKDCCIDKIAFSPNSKMLAYSFGDYQFYHAKDNELQFKNFQAILVDLNDGKKINELRSQPNETLKKMQAIEFSPNGDYLLTALNDLNVYSVNNGDLVRKFEFNTVNERFTQLKFATFSPDGKNILAVIDNQVKIFDVLSGEEIHNLNHNDEVSLAKFCENGTGVFTITNPKDGETQVFYADLNNRSQLDEEIVKFDLYKKKYHYNDIMICMDVSPNGKDCVFSGYGKTIHIRSTEFHKKLDILTGVFSTLERTHDGESKDKKSFLDYGFGSAEVQCVGAINKWIRTGHDEAEKIMSAEFNSLEDKIITASTDGTIRITSLRDSLMMPWGLECCKELSKFESKNKESFFQYAKFSPDDVYYYGVGYKNRSYFTDKSLFVLKHVNNGKNVWSFLKSKKFSKLHCLEFSPNSKFLLFSSKDTTTKMVEIESGKVIFNFKSMGIQSLREAHFTPDGTKVVILNNDGRIDIFNTKNGDHVQSFETHLTNYIVYFFDFNESGKTINIHCLDHMTFIFDLTSGRLLAKKLNTDSGEIYTLPNSPFYMCSDKSLSKLLYYVTPSMKVIGFEQLDAIYNRPDIVMDSLKTYFCNNDLWLIEEYKKAWERRITKLGLDKMKLDKMEISAPNSEFSIDPQIFNGRAKIYISAHDSKYLLQGLNIFINEVPVYSSDGISIKHLKKNVWDTTIFIPLSEGDNKIQVSVKNELGFESFKYAQFVKNGYPPVEPKTYFIGIGVNEFEQPNHNLKYCVKDVKNLSSALALYNNNIDTILLTNEQVTKEKILSLKELLQKTTVNDKVIISCSSHGLLDDSLNFYLATHDVDFEYPKSRGLRFEELEGLLDGIPARQKLLLLDACNSGVNDKMEAGNQVLAQNQATADSTKIGRGAKAKYATTDNQKFIQMNELFVNVRNKTGSVIISAAGGQQSALEGEAVKVDGKAIQNGAFTFSILECLTKYQGNSNVTMEELKISDLKNYVENRVEEITNGKQKPTSRQETMEIDWELWKGGF